MYKTFKDDYKFGKLEEDKQQALISKKFGEVKKTNDYCRYDYYNDEYLFELKSRNNKYKQFPTTLLPQDKILKDIPQKQIFLFNFTDGLYYIEYDEEKFKNYPLELFCRYKRKDFNDLEKKYYYIPIGDLTEIKF
jgi:hypothetical protein